MANVAGDLDAVDHQVGDAQQVGERLLLDAVDALLEELQVVGRLHLLLDVTERMREEAAGAARRIEHRFAELRVDHLNGELCRRTWRVELAGVAGALQVLQDLLVDVAEHVAGLRLVEVDVVVDLVDHLAKQRAALHVVEGVLEHAPQQGSSVAACAAELVEVEVLERREELALDESDQGVAGRCVLAERFLIGPRSPLEVLGDRGLVAVDLQLGLDFEVAVDLEEQQPAELADALRIAVDTCVLAHDVLKRLDRCGEGHGLMGS